MKILRYLVAMGVFALSSNGLAQVQMGSDAVPALTNMPAPPVDLVEMKRDNADRMTVEVEVAGRGPYRFLVDTGSERTVISRELAGKLALRAGAPIRLHSVVSVSGVPTVVIPNLKVAQNHVSVLDAPALSAFNIGADGMLGIDSLRSKRVLLDFKSHTMTITPTEEPSVRLEGDTIVVRAKNRKGRLIFTDAEIDGRRVTIIIDTGSQFSIGNLALQRMLERRNVDRLPNPVTIESVTGDSVVAPVARVGRIKIGGLDLTELAIAFVDAHLFKQLELNDRPTLLLGMNAMKAFDKIQIDFANKKVRFVLPGTSMRDTVRLALND
nr:retroviral-like aspartic protease family protein [uncultured Sphingomonas sp.]